MVFSYFPSTGMIQCKILKFSHFVTLRIYVLLKSDIIFAENNFPMQNKVLIKLICTIPEKDEFNHFVHDHVSSLDF